ncbi:Rrf2 family protein [Desulfitispora alkaliphila]|uniref:RrF2 family transcriptional regulator n=1 Tax=Desulfitispora alkaliphila TaxID=622674 RepID=UPI003D1FC3CE
MAGVVKISEMVSIALHSMVFIAAKGEAERINARTIAEATGASEAHLSKTLQRLVKAGLVRSVRGPKGGFVLAKAAKDISLLDVYEAIEGPLVDDDCPHLKECAFKTCILENMNKRMNREFSEFLNQKKLDDFKGYLTK